MRKCVRKVFSSEMESPSALLVNCSFRFKRMNEDSCSARVDISPVGGDRSIISMKKSANAASRR